MPVGHAFARTCRWIAIVALAVGVASCGDEPGRSGASEEIRTATATATASLEDTLVGMLPAAVSGCRPINRPEAWFEAAQASVSCRVEGARSVHFHRFADDARLERAYDTSLSEFDEPPAGVSCLDPPFAGPWTRDDTDEGTMQCYLTKGDRAVIEWTERATGLYGVLTARDTDLVALLPVWEGLSGGSVTPAPAPEPDPTQAVEFSEFAAVRTRIDTSTGSGYVHFVARDDDGSGEIVEEADGSDAFDLEDEWEFVEETAERRALVDALRRQMEAAGWTELDVREGGEWFEYRFGR